MKEKINNFINNNIFAQVFGILGFFVLLYCVAVAIADFMTGDFIFAIVNIIFCFTVIVLLFFIISLLIAALLDFIFFLFPCIVPKKFFNNKVVAVIRNIGLGYIAFSVFALFTLTLIFAH